MAWDAFDRMRVVDQPGSGQTAHRYGADGERATTTWANGDVERYFGGGLTERDGRLELHVGLGGPRQVARLNVPWVVGGSLGSVGHSVVYLHQGFGHGPSLVTDASGDVLEERFHEPYGAAIWAPIDVGLERVGWNGKPVDPSTGWSDHGARWHATRYARWLSTDPPLWGPEGWVEHGLGATPFGFVAGNPVMLWDADGDEPLRRERLALAEQILRNSGYPFERDPGRYDPSKSDHYMPNLEPRDSDIKKVADGTKVGTRTYSGLDDKGRPTGASARFDWWPGKQISEGRDLPDSVQSM